MSPWLWVIVGLLVLLVLPFAGRLLSLWVAEVKPYWLRLWSFVGPATSRTSSALGSRAFSFFLGAVLALLVMNGAKWLPGLVNIKWPVWVPVVVEPEVPPTPTKPTAVTYVWEKDNGPIPSPVRVALDKLNRQGIVATEFEDDTTDGNGDTPEQYKIALAEATKVGVPALVSQAGQVVLKVVKAPTTEAQVLEVAP